MFLVGEPKHHCDISTLNPTNCTKSDFLKFAIPLDKEGQLSSCLMYQRNYSLVTDDDVCSGNQDEAGNWSSSPEYQVPVTTCDSWVYDNSTFIRTMVTEVRDVILYEALM